MKLEWETEIDTPATIAILGGGPAAVEAALYARFLGYSVLVYDRGKIGDQLLAWSDYPMLVAGKPARWNDVTSPLGLAALEAQAGAGALPPMQKMVTCGEYLEKYLLPIARTDLLYDSMLVHNPVTSVSRLGCWEGNAVVPTDRADQEFRVLATSSQRGEYSQVVDIILDCRGPSTRRGLASGGGQATGQSEANSNQLLRGKQAVLGRHRERFAGKHWLLWGDSLSARANAWELCRLAEEDAATRVTWVVPKCVGESPAVGCEAEWWTEAGQLLDSRPGSLASMKAWGIESLRLGDSQLVAKLQTTEEEFVDLECDGIIASSTAALSRHWAELKTHLRVEDVVTQEPHYYQIGSQCSAVEAGLFAEQFEQIRRVFGMVGGRAELDLYATVRPSGS